MPRNTRNVWLSASIDGRSTELEGGPVSRDGGLSATIRQRTNGTIADERFRVGTFVTSHDRIMTEVSVDTLKREPFPSLSLVTERNAPGVTVTLDVPGLTAAKALVGTFRQTTAALTFATEAERDAFLSLLPAWREAQAEVSA